MDKTKTGGKATKGSASSKDDLPRATDDGRKGGQTSNAGSKGDKGGKADSGNRK